MLVEPKKSHASLGSSLEYSVLLPKLLEVNCIPRIRRAIGWPCG